MRKRIIVISVLFGLAFLTTALAPFIQSASNPIIQHAPTPTADCTDEGICPNPLPAANHADAEDTEMNDKNGNSGLPELSGSDNTKSVNTETVKSDVPDETAEDQTDGSKPGNEQEIEKENGKSDPPPAAPDNEPASWHMTFNVDCVSSSCIALSDTSAGMYVSACNDGGGEYRSVEFTPVDHEGRFVSYHMNSGDTPDFNYQDAAQISDPSSTFSYGPVPPHNCVTAVFESEFDDPPADHTEYKRFEFRLSADNGTEVQSTSAYADKYGCYVPPSRPGIGIVLRENSVCIPPDADTASYELRIANTGSADICRISLSADKPGSFRLKNGDAGGPASTSADPYLYTGTLYAQDDISFIFEEDLSGSSLSGGNRHTVNFNATGETCVTASPVIAEASAAAETEICRDPEQPAEPEISLDITAPAECSDPGSDVPDRFTVTVTNTGGADLCRLDIEGPEGSTVLSAGDDIVENETGLIDAGALKPGESVDIVFGYKPSETTDAGYTAHFSAKGYIEEEGKCTEAVTAESSAEIEPCEPVPDLDLDLTVPSDCSGSGSGEPDEFQITVTNTGNTVLCKVIVSGPTGAVFSGGGTPLVVPELKPGQSAIVTALYKGEPSNGSYKVSFTAEGYAGSGDGCEEKPSVTETADAEIPVCERVPAISADIIASDECHVYRDDSDPDRFDYEIGNPGGTEFCAVSAIFDVISNGTVVHTETIEIPAESLSPGASVHGSYEVSPEETAGILPGDTYSVRITADASVADASQACPGEPAVSAQDEAEKPVCPDIKPAVTVYNMNPACIDAGDTLKFKGLIDIDPHSAAERITVNTGKITWGGTEYACEITSVKKSGNTDFVNLPDGQKGTSYEFTDFGHGDGAVGFVCEAKTSGNEQMRNGRRLSFNASAAVVSAGSIPKYGINSDTVEASQKCDYAHTVLLPHTGDDGATPILAGLFSLFLICGGASSFTLMRRKRNIPKQNEMKE